MSDVSRPPNILFISTDQQSWNAVSAYGNEHINTPHMDRLAEKGMKFDNAFCQYPVCNPSRSSFLTGLRPDELGIVSNQVALRQKWPDIVTLPQLFRNNGYYTAGLGKLFHAGTDENGEYQGRETFFRDDASFDFFYSAHSSSPNIGKQGAGRKLGDGTVNWARWVAAEGGDLAQPDGMLAAESVRVIEENHDKSFFIAVGFHKPHDPFIAPKEYFDRYPLYEIQLAESPDDRTPLLESAIQGSYNFNTFEDRDRREFKRAYLACTTFVDAQVGKLLDAMGQSKAFHNGSFGCLLTCRHGGKLRFVTPPTDRALSVGRNPCRPIKRFDAIKQRIKILRFKSRHHQQHTLRRTKPKIRSRQTGGIRRKTHASR